MIKYIVKVLKDKAELYFENKLHRTDGPVVENRDWYFEGEHHRIDGPAVEYDNGDKEWYLNDVEVTEEVMNYSVIA